MPAETLEFKAELKQLLHLITHSLYSDREIFLRELISNASDAINKVRFDALANADKLEGNTDWKIKLTPDAAAGTLTVSDNGIGMTRQDVISNLGTVAQSGTKAFLEAAKQAGKTGEAGGLIGQFGVGFYSAFMVADKVTVVTRDAGAAANEGTFWESDGQGTYSIAATDKPSRGTDVTLHLKDDAKDFLQPWRLRSLVRKFSDFLEHPVVMDVEKEVGEGDDKKTETTEETLNSRKAVWLRGKSEVKPEEYEEFYKSLAHDTEAPADVIHYAAEGKTEFKVLCFVPAHKPFGFDYEEPVAGLRLYVQRVLIMDRCEQVLPQYLRFVKGVVDSADLPLNVSREILQQNPILDAIQKSVVKNVLESLAGMKNVEPDKYRAFYAGFGTVLKEGLTRDWSNREKVADLLLFESANTEAGTFTTFAEYAEKMPADQTEIAYLIGESAEQLRHSPYLEAFRAKGQDVSPAHRPHRRVRDSPTRRVQGEEAGGGGSRRGGRRRRGVRRGDGALRRAARFLQGEAARRGRRAPHQSAHRERRVPRRRRARHVGAHGAADGAHGPRRRHPEARAGAEPQAPHARSAARAAREGRRRPAPRRLRAAAVRTGGDRGGVEGERPGRVRPAGQRPDRPRRKRKLVARS